MKSKLIIGIVIIFIAIQFVPVDNENPPVISGQEIEMPSDVKAILKRSCYDCHSNETVWPAYAKIAPFSWFIVHDVDEGRGDLNFSNWASYSDHDKEDLLEELVEELEEDKMPFPYYTMLHSEAEITKADIKVLKDWVISLGVKFGDEDEKDEEHSHDDE